MNKQEFLRTLERLLKSLPKQESQKMLDYYAEMIEDRMEEGMSEENAVEDLGDVGVIAHQILSTQPVKEKKLSNPVKGLIVALLILGSPLWACIALALLALILTGLLLILTGYILIWLIPVLACVFMVVGLIVCCVSILGSPFVMASSFTTGLLQLGVGFVAAGLAILAGLFMVVISRFFVRMTVGFSHWLKVHVFCRMKEVHLWQS